MQAAEGALKSLQQMVQSLQQQLGHATPQQKPAIIASIKQINEQQIPAVERRIRLAKQALTFCRTIGDTHRAPGGTTRK